MINWNAVLWCAALVALLGAMLTGCQPAPVTVQQLNHPPSELGLPMQHLNVETQKVEPSIGEVEM